MKSILLLMLLVISFEGIFAEDETVEEPSTSVSVVNSLDTSGLELAEPLRMALGSMLQSTGVLRVQILDYSFSAVTVAEASKAFEKAQTDLVSFVYMDKGSVSVLLFANARKQEFIVSTQRLDDAPDGNLTTPFIEGRFVEAIQGVLADYNAGRFQPLPGAESSDLAELEEVNIQNASKARELYRELAALEEKDFYAGGNVGMVRYSQTANTGISTPSSTVNFGVYAGTRIFDRLFGEAGIDVFTHLFLHGNLRYHVPFVDKYVYLSVLGGVGKVMGRLTQNVSQGSTSDTLGTSILAGPGLAFDIPLLGCAVRAEANYYLGSTSVMIATYGVVIPF